MSFSSQYSRFDKALHRIAFGSKHVRVVMQDLEASLFEKRWQSIRIDSPVFITSLPRAGTTILLECLAAGPELVSYTYRDMPFVYSPVLWSKLSTGFRRERQKSERAHGDGLFINEDSPEAFEEIVWRYLTANAYGENHINLLTDVDGSTAAAFRAQLQKLLYVHECGQPSRHYLSKNNANIARIPALRRIFSDAKIVVPFRDPFEHAFSMWQQHLRFTEMHAADSFVMQYMKDLGHFEFGALHKPIAFPALSALTTGRASSDFSYWLAYWVAAFDYLADQPGIIPVSYEDLCSQGADAVHRLREALGLIRDPDGTASITRMLREPVRKCQLQQDIDQELAHDALTLHRKLKERCILACAES